MAINKNHEFEELDGVKCGIVEKNASAERVEFLKKLLEYNRYTVVVVASPAPKAATAPKAEEGAEQPAAAAPPPASFTIGVTDYTFNPINAIYGRILRTPDGHIVTPAYWQQQEAVSQDELPYYVNTKLNH